MNRPREIEEQANLWFIHPISRSLARALAKTGVHPNTISFAGIFCGFLAAVFYFQYEVFTNNLIGFALMVIWHILDGTDGQLARLTNQSTMTGKIIDGVADYSVFIVVTFAISVAILPKYGIIVVPVVFFAALSHIYQSAAYERQRENYMFWVYYDPTKKAVPQEAKSDAWRRNFFLKGLYIWYLGVQDRLRPGEATTSKKYAQQLGPKRWKKVQAKYSELYAPHLRQWARLSANTHTFAIFIFCALGDPMFYLLFQIVVLNAYLGLMLYLKGKKDEEFEGWLRKFEINKS